MIWIITVLYVNQNDPQVTQALLMLALILSINAVTLPQGFLFDLS